MAIGLFRPDLSDDFDETDEASSSPEFEKLIRRELELLGEDTAREGLDRTPERVAKAPATGRTSIRQLPRVNP
jgi:GTP cyclohydrolase I